MILNFVKYVSGGRLLWPGNIYATLGRQVTLGFPFIISYTILTVDKLDLRAHDRVETILRVNCFDKLNLTL